MEIMTKGEYAYRRLHDDIIDGKLPGGTRLVVKDLADEYQISAMPIRNAITRLEELGLVHTTAHQGAWVAEMNLRDYFTFMLLRVDAEALAATFAAQNRDDAMLQELENLYHLMEAARDANDYDTYGRMNRRSHNLVCEASGNPTLIEHITTLVHRTRLAASFFYIDPSSSKESCQEHWDWIKALRDRDSHRSAAILRYQRCRANLTLLHAIQDGSPNVQSNPFLKQAVTASDALQCVEEFIPIFEDIRQRNDYRQIS